MIDSTTSFRQMVREAQDWRDKIQSGRLSERERGEFENWLAKDSRHLEVYNQAETYWAAFEFIRPEEIEDKLRKRSLLLRLEIAVRKSSLLLNFKRPRIATAIMLGTLAFASFFISQLIFTNNVESQYATVIKTYQTEVGQTQVITLIDGTEATLGANSQISTKYSKDKRLIQLIKGAAIFNVVSDLERPFSVESGKITATALGTVFEVRNNGGVSRVSVAEGIVEVTHPYLVGNHSSKLTIRRQLYAGEQIAASESGLRSVEKIEVDRIGAWLKEMIIYKGATLTEIIADVNRYSTTPAILHNIPEHIANSEINVSFQLSDTDAMIRALPELFPIVVDASNENHILITPRN
ncbi:MAG: FecR domain-containing protein [Pseudomonadota bacterium]